MYFGTSVYRLSVGVSGLFSAVTGHNDVTIPRANAGVPSRNQVGVTVITGEPLEPFRKRQAVALGDATPTADVSLREGCLALVGRFPGQLV